MMPTALRNLVSPSQQDKVRRRHFSAYNLTTSISSSSSPRRQSKAIVQHPPTVCTSRQVVFACDCKVVPKGNKDSSSRPFEMMDVQ
jgi:hypothetical protein